MSPGSPSMCLDFFVSYIYLFCCVFPVLYMQCIPVVFLGDIADKRFRLLRSIFPLRGLFVCLFVCHVRALRSNDRSYRNIFLVYDSSVSLSDRV